MLVQKITEKLIDYNPRPWCDDRQRKEAGVLVLLQPVNNTANADYGVILTKRADNLSTHAGEVAFPGGKRDGTDSSILHTALRETHEELGVVSADIQVLGQLSPLLSKHGLKVTPHVAVVEQHVSFNPNEQELDEVFSVPLSFLLSPPEEYTTRLDFEGNVFYVPEYHYQGYRIWGLTAIILVELLNIAFDAKISLTR